MAERFKRLRAMGEIGGWTADILTILQSNLGFVVSAILGTGAGLSHWARALVMEPAVYIGGAVFLFSLWTLAGIFYLIDRRKPRSMVPFADYRYGLTLEGVIPNWSPENSPIESQRGMLGIAIALRNFSPGPIKYTLQTATMQFATRAMPKYKENAVSGYMARGGGKSVRPNVFPPGSLKEFYGAGEVKAEAEFVFTYGPPEGDPVRRLKLVMEMNFYFPKGGIIDLSQNMIFAYSDSVLSEEDLPIRAD